MQHHDEAINELPAVSTILGTQELAAPGSERPTVCPAVAYLASLNSKGSRYIMGRYLIRFALSVGYKGLLDCPWAKLDYQTVLGYRASLEEQGLTPASIAVRLCALRGVARSAWLLGQMSDHQKMSIEAISAPRGSRIPRGRALDTIESAILIGKTEVPENHASGARDAAIFALGIGCGLRRAEIATVRIDAISDKDHCIRIIGKGNKERLVFPSDAVWKRLSRWLSLRGSAGCPQVFVSIYRGRIRPDKGLTPSAVTKLINARQAKLGVARFSPHDMRRTYATRMLEAGADINIVRDAMGHASVMTTQIYDKRGIHQVEQFSKRIPL